MDTRSSYFDFCQGFKANYFIYLFSFFLSFYVSICLSTDLSIVYLSICSPFHMYLDFSLAVMFLLDSIASVY